MSFSVLGFGSVEKAAEAESDGGQKRADSQEGKGFKKAFHLATLREKVTENRVTRTCAHPAACKRSALRSPESVLVGTVTVSVFIGESGGKPMAPEGANGLASVGDSNPRNPLLLGETFRVPPEQPHLPHVRESGNPPGAAREPLARFRS